VAGIEWVAAGIIFPVSIYLFLPKEHGPVLPSFFAHFIFSQTLCGIMSLSIPWLATTAVALKAHYPVLLGAGTPDEWEQQQLGRLRRQSAWFLVSTIIVALGALLCLLTFYEPQPENKKWQWIIVVAALVTISLAFFLYQQIQEDLKVLLAVIRASDPSVTVSTTVDSI
jgi:hypothetical protein